MAKSKEATARRKQAVGICNYCQSEFAVGSMLRHLKVCGKRREAIAAAERSKRPSETLYHLHVQSADVGGFFLDLEVRGFATLRNLDSYLRAIWLECCGHLSRFSFGGWSDKNVGMARFVGGVFTGNAPLIHQYDFGTTSETLIRAVARRDGRPTTRHPIALMARNRMPDSPCSECGKPAGWLCIECLIEQNRWNTLCTEHAETHPHRQYGDPFPLVNSPRLGMCGYQGPADPPY